MYYIEFNTKIGIIHIVEENGFITKIGFGKNNKPKTIYNETELLNDLKIQILKYLDGKQKDFNVALSLNNNFYGQVYQYLLTIPYGEVRTYKQVAEAIKRPKAYRAVGQACNRNEIPIIIPCHRVIGSNNKLVGYRGGLDIKEKLIFLEKN